MRWIIKITSWLARLNIRLTRLTKYLALTAVGVMTAVILLQVFFRYVLNNSLPWSEELARYLMVWMTFLALPVVSRENQHAALEIVLGSLPGRLNALLQLVIYLLIGLVLVYAFSRGLDFALKGQRMLATALPITKFWSYVAMPIGFGLMMLVYLELALRSIASLICPDRYPASAPHIAWEKL